MLKIYIPICFYYFKYAIAFLTIIQIFTFQYVSIISQHFIPPYFLYHHLHSNMFLLFHKCHKPVILAKFIYIPICFYYFDVYRINRVIRTEFTFQYVSIISFNAFFAQTSMIAFTFQYVSIISEQTRKLNTEHFLFTFQYVSIISNLSFCCCECSV